MVKNIMTVDLEDYFCDLPFERWEEFEGRVIENTEIILELFEKHNVKATFFTLGYIGEKYPELIKKIYDSGHEIGSHSYAHIDLRKISKDDFEKDFHKAKNILEQIINEKIEGFRAPFFSINKTNSWILEILSKNLSYDSSIFPVKTNLYGVPDAPRTAYKPNFTDITRNNPNGKLVEIPLATIKIPIIGNIPIAGGFYLRFFPYWFIKFGINRLNKKGIPAMFYIHPKDLDSKMPKIKEYNWIYYHNLKSAKKKFEKILKNFEFGTAKEIIIQQK